MAPVIKRSSNLSGPAGLLKKMVVQPGSIVPVYSPVDTGEFGYISIRIVNPNEAQVEATVWIGVDKRNPILVDIIEPKLVFQANEIYISEGISMSRDETLYIEAKDGQLVVRIEGYENVIPI
jgi:hypothetical protein